MCLITKQDKPSIAEQDMTVYKLLKDDNELYAYAIYQYFKYEKGKLYKTNMLPDTQDPCSFDIRALNQINNICPGWSSCTSKMQRQDIIIERGLKAIGPGFHSCMTIERVVHHNKTVGSGYQVYECTIPKGSEYYTDGDGLIASNQIIVNRKLETKEYVLDN